MLTSESPQAKLARKQEAKNLKRQRIIDGGGKRPRKEVDNNDKNNNQRNTKKKKQQNNKSSFSSSSNGNVKNRFGRVMINTPCPNKPRTSTLSIAIPGSIVSNAQTTELRTYLIGQIARACTVYHVDEIIVFDDNLSQQLKVRSGYQRGGYHNRNRDYNNRDNRDYNRDSNKGEDKNQKSEGGIGNNEDKKEGDDQKEVLRPSTDPHTFMANILQYCECPQYLRRHFFPMHPDLQFAGLLNPLDAPHHVRLLDRCLFREGVVTDKKGKGGENNTDDKGGSLVDCGIRGKLVEYVKSLSLCTFFHFLFAIYFLFGLLSNTLL
jgi:predicted SPOUT superfamily RNA methylase MTH1